MTSIKSIQNPDFHKRLIKLIGDEKPFSWASRIGLDKGTFSRIWNKGTLPSGSTLKKIADRSGVSISWLLTGVGPVYIDGNKIEEISEYDEEYNVYNDRFVIIPNHTISKTDDSNTNQVTVDNFESQIAFHAKWITERLRLNPSDLMILTVIGDAMYSTLCDGDTIMVNTNFNGIEHDAIYVLRLVDTVAVRRIQRLFGGKIVIHCDNPAYNDQTLTEEEVQELEIIGKVVWAGHNL